jgi:hypothetical protein
MPEAPRAQLAELKIHAQDDFIGLAKRVATSLGGLVGFNLEKIDELAIAVTQACGSAIEQAEDAWGPGATLKLTFSANQNAIYVDVDTIAPSTPEALEALPRALQQARQAEVEERRAHQAQRARAQADIERAVAREMIRLFVDEFLPQVDTSRRQVRYRMVKYLIS